jgi:glutamate N-acetyltransferase/amino-acid N-acetyltransferase
VVDLPGGPVTIAGIAKGSGMIAPDMGTMLVYVFTDARLDRAALQRMTSAACERSFNRITVDGDTSTSDTLLVAATGASGVDATGQPAFAQALEDVFRDLAQQVVRDGEGATKFIAVHVTGAASDADARNGRLQHRQLPPGQDRLRGRGRQLGPHRHGRGQVRGRGRPRPPQNPLRRPRRGARRRPRPRLLEEAASAYMTRPELEIGVDLGLGPGEASVWTCDLTHGYVDINADYRS